MKKNLQLVKFLSIIYLQAKKFNNHSKNLNLDNLHYKKINYLTLNRKQKVRLLILQSIKGLLILYQRKMIVAVLRQGEEV